MGWAGRPVFRKDPPTGRIVFYCESGRTRGVLSGKVSNMQANPKFFPPCDRSCRFIKDFVISGTNPAAPTCYGGAEIFRGYSLGVSGNPTACTGYYDLPI